MQLSWSQQDRLAEALWAAYPEQDRLTLDPEALRRLIIALPGFNDAPQPPSRAWLNKVLWTWMRIADERGNPPVKTDKKTDTTDDTDSVTECASPPCYAGEKGGS